MQELQVLSVHWDARSSSEESILGQYTNLCASVFAPYVTHHSITYNEKKKKKLGNYEILSGRRLLSADPSL